MRWWLKAKVHPTGPIFLIAGLVATIAYSSSDFPAPRLGVASAVPAALIIPAFVVVALVILRNSAAPVNEYRAARSMTLYETCFTVVLLALCSTTLLAAYEVSGDAHLVAATRNLLAYSGIALMLRYISSGTAAVGAVAYSLLLAVLGNPAATWGFPLRDAQDATAWVSTGILLLTGLSVSGSSATILRSERRP